MYRQPSLQSAEQLLHKPTPTADTSTGATFADMARKGHSRELFEGETPPTSGLVPLAGLLRFKTTRNKGNKAWRPLEASDFNEDIDDEEQDQASRYDGVEPLLEEERNEEEWTLKSRTLHTEFGHRAVEARQSFSPKASRPVDPLPTTKVFDDTQNVDLSPTRVRTGVMDNDIARVFGRRLPDPIHLQQVLGHEDGEVIFVGHPNRDVSAHQWSQNEVQWINIGQFSHSRRKVEGQLASDRLRGQTAGSSRPQNSLTYFKAIADQRYVLAKESTKARPEHTADGFGETMPRGTGEGSQQTVYSHRPIVTVSNRFGSLSSASTPTPVNGGPALDRLDAGRELKMGQPQPPKSTMRNVHSNLPADDPFISTPTMAQKANRTGLMIPATPLNRGQNVPSRIPGMDFNFEFPPKCGTSQDANSPAIAMDGGARRDFFKKQEQARILQLQDLWPKNERPASLRDVCVGEEATSNLGCGDIEFVSQRDKFRQDLMNLGNVAERTSGNCSAGDGPLNQFESISRKEEVPGARRFDTLYQRQNHQAHLVPPGFEKALPTQPQRPVLQTRTSSILNAKAPTYHTVYAPYGPPRNFNGSPSVPSVTTAANLGYSDPDNVQLPNPEIATSVTDKNPIKQTFTGPFFMDTMPTSYAPSTPLAPRLGEGEKLQAWWTDGQRPARQQEYYKTIMSTSTKSRARGVGLAPGGPVLRGGGGLEIDSVLVPVIENLREYVDEMNSGSRDYFTRSYAPPPPFAIDRSGTGNYSFFGEDCGATPQRIGRDARYSDYNGPQHRVAASRIGVGARGNNPNLLAFQRFGLGGFGRMGVGVFGPRASHAALEREFGGVGRLWDN